jgi:hypothetical protein
MGIIRRVMGYLYGYLLEFIWRFAIGYILYFFFSINSFNKFYYLKCGYCYSFLVEL